MTSPDRDPELERMLRSALHAESARTTVAGDGLAKIRARTSSRTGFAHLFRPAVAGAALAFTLVAGTLIGINVSRGGEGADIAAPAGSGAPATVADPPKENPPADDPAGSAPALVAPSAETSAVASGVPAVTAPPTGLAAAEPAAVCVPNTSVPPDDGGSYIAISSPGSGCPVNGPTVEVSGTARVFEAALNVDAMQNGVALHTANVTASEGAPGLGTWSTQFSLRPGNYRIEAYYLSAKDGSRVTLDTVWISVLEPGAGTAAPGS